VIAAHAGLAFPGAAIGPDLFFVLSGYLITGLLLRRLDAGRGVELAAFYARRLRRLLPAAVVAVGLTVGVVALLGDPFALERAAHDGIAALTGTANLRFAITLQDYFAPTEPSVFLPLWSLGVEEQFCLLVPLFIGVAYRTGGRRGVAALVALIAVASTIAAVLLTASDPVWAYYLLPTRAYAIAIGALLALGEQRVRGIAAPFGLAVITAILLLVPGEEGYPGIVGPVAALASALLIGGMAGGGLIARVIALTPLRLVGRISYSLFLLHWPFLVVPPMYGVEMTPALTLLAVTGSVGTAVVLYLAVERPFREGALIGSEPRKILPRAGALAGSAVLFLTSLSVPPITSAGDPVLTAIPIAVAPIPSPSSPPLDAPWQVITPPPAREELFEGPVPTALRDDVRAAATDADAVIRSGCGSNHNDSTRVPICRVGVAGGPRIIIVGDSHAAHWVPGLTLAATAYGWELISMTKSSCTFTDLPLWSFVMQKPYVACTAWREAVLSKVDRLEPALVIVASGRYVLPADRRAHSADYYADGLRRMLVRIDAPLAMIADTPHGEIDIPACLARNRDNVAACVVDRDEAYGRNEPSRSRRIAEALNIPLIDMGPADLRPDLADADRDADDVLRRGCGLAHDGETPPLCIRGVEGGTKIAIIGTSHAAHWVPAIEEVAASAGYEIRPFVKVNCPFVDHRVFAARLGRPYHECHAWREAVIEAVNAWGPALVLIASARHEDLDGVVNTAAESAEAVARLLRRLQAPVAIIADTPYGQIDIPSCLARHRDEIAPCTIDRSATAYAYGTARDLLLAERETLPIIDFTPTFCPGRRCAPIIDGIVVYHDHHHLTATMSRHLAAPLGAAIATILASEER